MATKDLRSLIKDFPYDVIITSSLLIILIIISTLIAIIITGNREGGMVYGLIGGLASTFILIYLTRGQFSWAWTILQLILNAGLTLAVFMGLVYLVKDTEFYKESYGYVCIFVSIPLLISLNKVLLDILVLKLKGTERKKSIHTDPVNF